MSKQVLIYHNPRCQKSRVALAELEAGPWAVTVKEYLKESPSAKELKVLCAQLGIKPLALIRKKEPLFKELYQGKELSDAQWLQAMEQHPVLIERPIVVKDGKAIVAREEGALDRFLK